MPEQPAFAYVMNTGKTLQYLYDGHGDSVPVVPHHTAVKIQYKFTTWTVLPAGVKIIKYELNNGSIVNTWPPASNNVIETHVAVASASEPENTEN